MNLSFDQAVSEAVRTCQAQSGFDSVTRACLVRDLEGRVRLVLDLAGGDALNVPELEGRLAAALGDYFTAPILTTASGATDERRLAQAIIDQATAWPRTWMLDPDPISGAPITPFASWRVLQRLHSKHAWLSAEPVEPPWSLSMGMPAIVSFYSFKGGVGRTTLLAAVARLLAASGKRVVLIDLDLEAPGLGAFLEVDTERGVIDFIIDYLVTGVPDLQRCHGAASALGDALGARAEVIPAGRMNWAYVEKLGRLDFSDVGLGTESSVSRAVRALIDAARTEFAPDYILIDSRAGLHDIGGLSLHALAHVDVLVARATSQNLVGLEIALQTLGRRKHTEDLRRLLIAHTFAPRREERETRTPEEEAFLQQVYALFSKWIYLRSNLPDQVEQRESDDAPHFPRPITQHADLERINSISAAPTALLDGEDFRRLCDRLVELCEPEDAAEDDDPPATPPVSLPPPEGDAQ